MTEAQVKDLLKKVELLEAKAAILQEEVTGIRVMLQDIIDPENRKSKAAFERAKEKAEREAAFQEDMKRRIERMHRNMYGPRRAKTPGSGRKKKDPPPEGE